MTALSVVEMSAALGGLSEEEVLELDRAGKLLSVMCPNSGGAAVYPAFQATPGVWGAPMQKILSTLSHLGKVEIYTYFSARSDFLEGLTPAEVLSGSLDVGRPPEHEVAHLLALPLSERLRAVIQDAQVLVAIRSVG